MSTDTGPDEVQAIYARIDPTKVKGQTIDPISAEVIAGVLDAAKAFIESEVGRPLWGGPYALGGGPQGIFLDGNGSNTLALPDYPIQSITGASVGMHVIPPATGTTDLGWILDQDAGLLVLRGYVFTRGTRNVNITGTAGEAAPPPDAVEVAYAITARTFKRYPDIHQASISIAQATTTFAVDELTPAQKKTLGNLKRWL